MAQFPNLDPAFHKEIFRVTDRMRKLRNNPEEITVREYNSLLQELCRGLNGSIEHGLKNVIFYAADLAQHEKTRTEARAVVSDIAKFAQFIEFETKALVGCAASEETAREIAKEVTELRGDLANASYNPDEIYTTILKFRDDVCATAGQVKEFVANQEAMLKLKKDTLLGFGVGLSIANGAAIVITLGAGAPLILLSSMAGGLLITWRGTLDGRANKPPQ